MSSACHNPFQPHKSDLSLQNVSSKPDAPQSQPFRHQNGLRMHRMPHSRHHSIEPVVVISGVLHHPNGTIRLRQRVLPFDHIPNPHFRLLLAVASLRVPHSVLELVPGRSLQITKSNPVPPHRWFSRDNPPPPHRGEPPGRDHPAPGRSLRRWRRPPGPPKPKPAMTTSSLKLRQKVVPVCVTSLLSQPEGTYLGKHAGRIGAT